MANLEPKDTSNSFTRHGRIYEARVMLIETHMSDLHAFDLERGRLVPKTLPTFGIFIRMPRYQLSLSSKATQKRAVDGEPHHNVVGEKQGKGSRNRMVMDRHHSSKLVGFIRGGSSV